MPLKSSTGLRNQMLDTAPLRTILNLGVVNVYSGTTPATADDALGGAVLLYTLSNASTVTGLTFEPTASASVLAKKSTETWSGLNIAGGVASFYRHVAPGDTGVASTTQPRIQGSCGVAGADMNMTSTTMILGATTTQNFYTINLPTL